MSIATCLLVGAAVGVAAQDAETGAPAEFSATWDTDFGPGVRPNRRSSSDPVHDRGYANHPLIVESSGDPRFEGEVTMTVNRDEYPSDGALTVFHRAETKWLAARSGGRLLGGVSIAPRLVAGPRGNLPAEVAHLHDRRAPTPVFPTSQDSNVVVLADQSQDHDVGSTPTVLERLYGRLRQRQR